MYFKSKKITLVILGLTGIVCSRGMFSFINDPEGPNLLIVMVLAMILYFLSLTANLYLLPPSFTDFKRLLSVILIQVLIVTGLYFCLN